MTIDEAIKFVQNINTQGNRYAHFVDMDDFSAISTIADKNGNYSVNCYKTFYDTDTNACHAMIKKCRIYLNHNPVRFMFLVNIALTDYNRLSSVLVLEFI